MAIIGGFTDLEFLQLDGSNVTDQGFAHVANLKKLTILDMPGVRITDLAPVPISCNSISSSSPRVGPLPRSRPRPWRPVEPGAAPPPDESHAAHPGDYADRGSRIGGRRRAPQTLQLHDRREGDHGGRLGPDRRIQEPGCLRLADTSIADLRSLSPRLHAISTLWMENSHLTDAGIEPLSRVIRLTDLTIAGSRMTDAGLDHLASLTSL